MTNADQMTAPQEFVEEITVERDIWFPGSSATQEQTARARELWNIVDSLYRNHKT